MNAKKLKVFLVSAIIGIITTSGTVYSSGFTPDNILNWIINALFVTAIAGFLGTIFFPDESIKRKPK